MKEWDNNFDQKRNIEGKNILIGRQDFENATVMIKEESGNIVDCPMLLDEKGNIYFIYNGMGVYISNYMGEFML